MSDIAMAALFLVAFLKSVMSCLYGPRFNPEKYLASMGGGSYPDETEMRIQRPSKASWLLEASNFMLSGAHS